MSAFIVDNEHIRVLIAAGLDYTRPGSPLRWAVPDSTTTADPDSIIPMLGGKYRHLTPETAATVGQILMDQNVRSFNYRYDEDQVCVYDHGAPADRRWTPVEILKAIDAYEYQACEDPNWETSEAHAITTALRDLMISALPGYSEAAWSIDPDRKPLAVQKAEAARA